MTTPVTPPLFRSNYPEFSSTDRFPNSGVQYWLDTAYSFLNASRWGKQLDIGVSLYVAHNLSLEARAQAEAANGGVPGGQVGPVSSKSIDKVSVGYDTGAGTETGAGHWNSTIYGTRFFRLVKMFGSGPIQVGMGVSPPNTGLPWPGPLTTPGFTNFGN